MSKTEVHSTDRPRGTPSLGILRAALWLAFILVAAKAFYGNLGWWPLPADFLTLIAVSWRDVLFALACGVFGALVALALARWRRLAALAYMVSLAAFALFAAYAVAAISLFRYFNRPLTYDLLWLVSTVNVAAVQSSIAERITVPTVLALFVVPVVFLVLATRNRWSGRSTIIAFVIAAAWVSSGLLLQNSGWQRKLEFLKLSPHVELLRSATLRWTDWKRVSFQKDFPAEYVAEFRTFGARAPGPKAHFKLPAGVTRPKNAIVVVLESVGTKYLGLYGALFDVTPTLSAEARHALVFENIYAHASFTYASFRPINFSVYPGLPWHYSLLEDARPLPETLAARMKARGSRTAYITSGDVDLGAGRWLLERSNAFDLVQGAYELGCPILSSWGTEDRCAIDRLLHWIDEKPDEPFFAIVWSDQTHDPYIPSRGSAPIDLAAKKGASPVGVDLARYLQVLRDTDAQLARVFAALRARGLAEDTFVIVTGDHGEAFGDPHSQRGHAHSVFEEEVRVPLMIWNPRLFPVGGRSRLVGGHVDLNPTVADLLGVVPPGEWQGHSLFDPARPNRTYFMAISGGDVFGVREADWKYALDMTSGRESLFNLAADPEEQRDLSASQPDRAKRLRQRVAAWVTFLDAFLWRREN